MIKGGLDLVKQPSSYEGISIPEMSLPELLHESVAKHSQKVAMTFGETRTSYGDMLDRIQSLAQSLKNLGVKRGDHVALMLPNCPQYPISYYAVLYLGATVVQVNPMYKPPELLHILRDAEVSVFFILEDLMPVYDAIKNDVSLREIIPVSLTSPSRYDELVQQDPIETGPEYILPKQDVAIIQYTGGTTGRSKGVMLTHFNIVANTFQAASTQVETEEEESTSRVLTVIPLFHVYGMTSAMVLTFHRGGDLILLPRFDVEQVVHVIETMKPTYFPGVPTMYLALYQYYQKRPFDLSSIMNFTSGSAPLPVEMMNKLLGLSSVPVLEGYGLSEASPTTHRNPVDGVQKPGSIGIPIPNTESKVVDVATGKNEVLTGEVGELVVKGPQVMKGYYKLPDETAATLRDGWLFTGDLAKQDEDGYFYIVGRKKELIIASGFNVYPIEVEDVLYRIDGVEEAAVVGVPDPYRGETVKAFIVKSQEKELTTEQIERECKEKLAAYKVPKIISFIDELPKTAVGKILKRELITSEKSK